MDGCSFFYKKLGNVSFYTAFSRASRQEYGAADPGFTMRRKMEHLREEREQIRQLRNVSRVDLAQLPYKIDFISQIHIVILFSNALSNFDHIIGNMKVCHTFRYDLNLYPHVFIEP